MSVLLLPDQVAFLQGPLSMNVGAVGRDGWPCVTRAQGIVISRDRRTLTVWLSVARSRAVLDALDAGSAITLVASRPATHATLQLKAARAERVAVTAAHRAASARCVAGFGAELAALGYGDGLTTALTALLPTDDLTGLRSGRLVEHDLGHETQAGRVLARA